MENRDELYDKLFVATTELLDAVEKSEIERLGKAIDIRQQYIDRLSALESKKMTDQQKAKYNEIVILDQKASNAVRQLLERFKNDIKNSRVKYDGMIKYNNSSFDLSSGRMIDKKR